MVFLLVRALSTDLTVYITCLFSCLIPGHASETYIIPNLLAQFYYATQENKWLSFLTPYLKPWITPALNADGTYNRTLVEASAKTRRDSMGGVARATISVGSVYLRFLYHARLPRRHAAQWAEREALRFPLLELPVALARSGEVESGKENTREYSRGEHGSLLRNSMTWIGFGLAFLTGAINGLNYVLMCHACR